MKNSKTESQCSKKRSLDAESTAPNLIVPAGAVQFKAAGGKDPYERVFELLANNGGHTHLDAYPYPIVFDLKTIWTGAEQIPLLMDHDSRKPVGSVTDLVIGTENITGRGITNVPGPDREKVVDAADAEFVWQLSIGGTADEDDIFFIDEHQTLEVNGRALQGPFYFVINYHLREISFVALGADNEGATATLLAALKSKGLAMNFLQWLASKGKDINSLTASELSTLRAEFDVWQKQTGSTDGGDDTVASSAGDDSTSAASGTDTVASGSEAGTQSQDGGANAASETQTVVQPTNVVAGTTEEDSYLQRRAQEVQQAHTLETLNAQYGNPNLRIDADGTPNPNGERSVSLLAHAMSNNWSRDRFELFAERANMPRLPDRTSAGGVGNTSVDLNAALIGGLLLRAGVPLDTTVGNTEQGRRYLNASMFGQDVNAPQRQRWMNEASRFQHYSLAEMVQQCGLANGIDLNASFGHFRGNPQWIRAAFSSQAIADMFTQSISAVLLDSYEQQNNTLFPLADRQPVPNFLLNERPRMLISGNDFEQHHATQTASEMQLSSTGEEYRIARYSKMLTVNEETLINERFDVIKDQPRAMGMAAARIDPELILAVILNNPNMKDGLPFISAAAGNLRTGSSFTTANLKAAYTAFTLQTEGGVSLNLEPDIMLHSRTSGWDVLETLADAGLITGTGGTQTSKNVVANLVQPISDARFDNGFNDPADRSTAVAGEPGSWVLANTRYPAIELGHLAGTNGMLQIDSGNLTQGQWGIWFAGKKDAGAAPLRRESIQKNES